jgi:glycosyltransferase involved in cell wall biosynthesis
VLEAIALLKNEGLDFQVVFTGSQSDPRNKEYFDTLSNFIKANGIEKYIKFLGFIERSEQLSLIANARAVIQPSLFEGWSTVVEDSKAVNQYIILSNINVHREQISENVSFFDPHSPEELANAIRETVLHTPHKKNVDYQASVKAFSRNVLRVLQL